MKLKRKQVYRTKRKPRSLAVVRRIAVLEKLLADEREFRAGNKQLIKELTLAVHLEKTTTIQIDAYRQLFQLRSSDSWKRAASYLVSLFQAGRLSHIDIALTNQLANEFAEAAGTSHRE